MLGNQFRTAALLALMTALIMWVGHMLGGRQGMMLALVVAAGMNFFSYWYSDKIVLKMYSAKAVGPADDPELFGVVQSLSQRANLPMPKLYVIPKEAPNAFATGRNPAHAAVAVTEGLRNLMTREEITGVLAHELSHVRNRDILIGSIVATMAGAIMMIANMARFAAFFGGVGSRDDEGRGGGGLSLIVMAILAPMAAMLIQMAISRSREYLADATGAGFAGTPEGLAKALEKLGAYSKRLPMGANPSTAHLFIVNPLSGRSLMNLFSTHPPLEERIARLRGRRDPGPGSPAAADEAAPTAGERAREEWERLSGRR